MIVLVAENENQQEVTKAERYLGSSCLRIPLRSADYAGDGLSNSLQPIAWGLERKRTEDLARCITQSHRHLEQVRKMAEDYAIRYFVWERGTVRVGGSGLLEQMRKDGKGQTFWVPVEPNLAYTRLLKHLETLSNVWGVRLRHTTTYRETCLLIQTLAEYWIKPPQQHNSATDYPRDFSFDSTRPALVPRMTKELDGIGWELSGRFGKAFLTPHELDQAGAAGIAEIEGIGPGKLASVLREWYGEEEGERRLLEWAALTKKPKH